MQRPLFALTFVAQSMLLQAQAAKVDTVAMQLLDRMTDMIGNLQACTFTLNTSNDALDRDHGMVTHFDAHQVYMSGPDRLHVNSKGDKGHRGYWYDGVQLVYYSFTQNNFGIMEAPSTTLETIDEIHLLYDVDFPAADFFYPSFTDDLIAQSTIVAFMGADIHEGKDCFRLVAQGKEQTVQLWIANDATFLPVAYIITDHLKDNAQFRGTFSSWVMDPSIPSGLFEFLPPPHARRIEILPRTTP